MDPLIEFSDLTIEFGATRALDSVHLQIEAGEVHGLLGHNGSGKSTLIKVLAGIYHPSNGSLKVNGKEVSLPLTPQEVAGLGLAFVHQGLGLARTMSVLDNLAVGSYLNGVGGGIAWRKQRAKTREQLLRFGLDLELDRLVDDLEPVEQAIIAIARAASAIDHTEGPRLLVLDEPTVYLPRSQVDLLFSAVRSLVDQGDSVLFVSHRLEEVLRFTDRVSVLRGGKRVAQENTANLSEPDLVHMILGERVETESPAVSKVSGGPKVAEISDLSTGNLTNVSFDVHAGEVLGVTGLAGSGFGDIPYGIYGAKPATGTLRLDGASQVDLAQTRPRRALANNIVLVPADRSRFSVVGEASIAENLGIPALKKFLGFGFLSGRRERKYAKDLTSRFEVRLADVGQPIADLSGGNQQKCVLAKWLSQNPRLVVMDEPTQGVDVGGRFDIWRQLREVAATGAGVIVASESSEEVAELCDRVLIFRDGQIVDELVGDRVDKHVIADACLSEATATTTN